MTTLLPSQREERVYVGPAGLLVRAAPTVQEEDEEEAAHDEDHEAELKATTKKRWQAAKAKISGAESAIETMRTAVREASHGVSCTRTTSKFAEQLAGALASARLHDMPSLVDSVDDQMQIEILSALPIASTSAAMRVCKSWHALFHEEHNGLWTQLVAAASCRAVDAAQRKTGPASWPVLGRQMQSDAASLQTRWLSGTCYESVLRDVHCDYVMSMVLHEGRLISSSADRSIAVTEVSQHLRKTHAGTYAGTEAGGSGVVDAEGRTALRRDSGEASEAAGSSISSRRVVPPRMLYGHRGQVLCVHAFREHLASCGTDGEVLVWTLPDAHTGVGGGVHRRHRFGNVYALSIEERGIICGGDGSCTLAMRNADSGQLQFEMPDEEPPAGLTTCVLRPPATPLLAAGNSDTHSQVRVWDLHAAKLRDRFTLPSYTKGVRCIASPSESTLLGGTTNGWVMHFDLRTGRYERRFAHADCCNALAVTGNYLVSAGDDKAVRITDLRNHRFSPMGSHRVRSVVFAACCDEESIFVGCDGGDVRILDYSAEANPETAIEAGGFTAQQKEALSAALDAAQRGSPSRPAHRTPGRIRPAH